ncbi:hypothetical protein PM082_007127 [Marasmius tenuissimus]|nr:hypothetical protein PM082_007127 [Marasmius tenuissimus]
MRSLQAPCLLLPFIVAANAHVAAWSRGMYCMKGTTPGVDDKNNNVPVFPLFELSKKDWWMQGITGCVNFPPPAGEFLELPANGEFKVELSTNRATTTFGFGGDRLTKFVGPIHVPENQFGKSGQCITDPNSKSFVSSIMAPSSEYTKSTLSTRQLQQERRLRSLTRYLLPREAQTQSPIPL